MVSETPIYYLNICFNCKHSNIITTFLSQGELNKNLICHINFVQKCRYPKPVASMNPQLPYYFIKLTFKALDIFRIQQNGPSNAFISRDFRNRQMASGYRAHAGSGQAAHSKSSVCQTDCARLFVRSPNSQSLFAGFNPAFWAVRCCKYSQSELLIRILCCFSDWGAETPRVKFQGKYMIAKTKLVSYKYSTIFA